MLQVILRDGSPVALSAAKKVLVAAMAYGYCDVVMLPASDARVPITGPVVMRLDDGPWILNANVMVHCLERAVEEAGPVPSQSQSPWEAWEVDTLQPLLMPALPAEGILEALRFLGHGLGGHACFDGKVRVNAVPVSSQCFCVVSLSAILGYMHHRRGRPFVTGLWRARWSSFCSAVRTSTALMCQMLCSGT